MVVAAVDEHLADAFEKAEDCSNWFIPFKRIYEASTAFRQECSVDKHREAPTD